MSPGGAIMHRAKRVAEPLNDYFVITKLVGPRIRPIRWTWQIRRRSMPLSVKYDGEEYATAQDARLAGEKALKEFLLALGGDPLMKSAIVSRSIVIDGHKTGVSLEDAFWSGLKEIANARGATVSQTISEIDKMRRQGGLSSAIRLFVLEAHMHGTKRT
jgi:predicted DNA-binding ribbon-helix-helix protein